MSLFSRKNSEIISSTLAPAAQPGANANPLAEMALNTIHDGVIMTDGRGLVQYINPAAANMAGCGQPAAVVGSDLGLLLKVEAKDGRALSPDENPILIAVRTGQTLEGHQCRLVSLADGSSLPIAVTVIAADGGAAKIVTFRNITTELERESEQSEFVSTASHEMRTPIATIDGYVSLALNPQTATIDDRARGYLDSASKAAKHLGKLFQDLLDVTKLDDGRIRPNLVPVQMADLVREAVDGHAVRAREAGLDLVYGTGGPSGPAEIHKLEQVIYASVDPDFFREIMDNLIDNAIKYTASGGQIHVAMRGDADTVTISVADNGMGISSADLAHVFQKFYRADNSDTRTIGGTGLGLYLVKQRAESMGGRVWAESAPGLGSTFYVSLPRISPEEYNKRMIAVENAKMIAGSGPGPGGAPGVAIIDNSKGETQ